MRLSQYPIVILCGLGPVLLGGCAGDDGSDASPEEVLRQKFPEQSALVLSARGSERSTIGVPAPLVGERRLEMQLPERGDGAVHFRVKSGAEVWVREEGAFGERKAAGNAMAFARARGTSYWTASNESFEEWLLLEPGVAFRGETAAAWEVDGATVRQSGDFVEVLDVEGVPRIRVTAPVAYAAGGRPVEVKLEARGDHRIELSVDAEGEEVLVDPGWTSTSMMIVPRDVHYTVLLSTGKVLVIGGMQADLSLVALSELYDPALDVWTATGPLNIARYGDSNAVVLPNGKVFVAGSWPPAPAKDMTPTSEIYDPSKGTWTLKASMHTPRGGHSMTLLADGRVLAAGGFNMTDPVNGTYLTSTEIYSPATDTWTVMAPMKHKRNAHAAHRLKDGRVVVLGGNVGPQQGELTTEIYDPVADIWTERAPDTKTRVWPRSTLLPNGKILVVDTKVSLGPNNEGDAELYDPDLDQWTPTGLTPVAGWTSAIAVLPSGRVVRSLRPWPPSKETSQGAVYNPTTNVWTATKPLAVDRSRGSGVLLPSGDLVITGGYSYNLMDAIVPFAEVYYPGAPLGAKCGGVDDCESGFCVDGVCCDLACDGSPCTACSRAKGASFDGTCSPVSGPACDDNNPCTRDDTCTSGVCGGAKVVCEAPAECYEHGVCDPTTGLCVSPARADGAACGGGVCMSGLCRPNEDPPPTPPASIQPPHDPSDQTGVGCSCEMVRDRGQASPLVLLAVAALARRRRRGHLASRT